jgi:predicted ferric reductase
MRKQNNARKLEKYFWTGFALTCPVIPLILYFAGNWYSFFHSYSLGMVLGIFSYVYFINTLIISSRIRYFDRVFGHDRILVFHGYLANTAMLLALGHYLFKVQHSPSHSSQLSFGVVGFYIFATVITVTLLFMVTTVLQKLDPFKKIRTFSISKLKFDYSYLKLFHNFSTVAAFFIAIHVFLASSTQESVARMVVMASWAFIGMALFVYNKVIKTILAYRKSYFVSAVKEITPDITELQIKRSLNSTYKYREGQFGYFRILSPACGKEEHPFTISSPPCSDYLSITVKNLGDYTSKLKNVAVGSKMLFDGPYGKFTPCQTDQNVFIAGGIGITPFLSILREWDYRGIKVPVTLVWSCRTSDEMFYLDYFLELQKKNPSFVFIPVVSRRNGAEAVKRIDKLLLQTVINDSIRKEVRVYLCGPEPLRLSVVKDLKTMGVKSGNVHFEKFSF